MKESGITENGTGRLAWGLEELAKATGLSKSFLRLEIRREKLKVLRLGRRILVRADEVERYLSRTSDDPR